MLKGHDDGDDEGDHSDDGDGDNSDDGDDDNSDDDDDYNSNDDDYDGDEEHPNLYWSRLKGGKIVASLLTDLVNTIQEMTKSTKTEFKILIRKRRSPLCNVGQSDSLAKTKTKKTKTKAKRQRRKKNKDKDGHLFTMLDRVITWTVAGLRLAHCHHLLLALLLEFHLKFYLL